jgi:uncharacterized repeat protein (TIGR01451 family)
LFVVPSADAAYAPELRRYPYLTDVVGSSATVNWGTNTSQTTAVVKWGPVGGSCTANTANATRTAITVNGVNEYQWSAPLTVTPNTQYCYRVYFGTSPQVDLLATDPSPQFYSQLPAGSAQSFSFAVLGDWGEVLNSNGTNPDLANVMQRISSSGVRFAVTTGDNAYPSGSQTNYGDLVQKGANVSAIFGPSFWTVPGKSIPIFPATGNHGMSTGNTHLLNWQQDQATSSSNGRYISEEYCCLNGTNAVNYPSAWYAFDAGNARFYVLTASWGNSNVGTADLYENDYDYHWTATSAEYQWLQNDLTTHAAQHKFAFFHFPLYSDQSSEESDTWLQSAAPPQPWSSLEGLLSAYGVDLAFTGHAHIYQRNLKPHVNSLPSYVTGGGGADIQSIGSNGCSSVDAYGIGWSDSSGTGNKCGSAPVPTSRAQVNHFLKVTVNGSQVTVTPTNSLGQTFDVQSYGAPAPVSDVSATKADSPDPVLRNQLLTYTVTARNNGPFSATGVTITDDLPASATYDSATATQGGCTQLGTRVTCSLGTLASNASATATIKVRPQAEGAITNNASIQANQADPVTTNNQASVATTVNPATDLSLTKTDSPDPVLAGDTLTYSLTAQNNGPSAATGVTLTDTLPAGVTYQSATPSQGTCGQASGVVTCNLGAVASGGAPTVQIAVRPQAGGTITNTASVTGAQGDPTSANNTASAQTTVTPAADLALTKTDSPDPVLVGGSLTYNLTVQNNGPSGASGVTLTDTLPVGVTYQSATPSQGSCSQASGTVTCNLGSLTSSGSGTAAIVVTPQSAGTITNTATVAGAQTDPVAPNNGASAQTTVNPVADLALTKTDSPDPVLVGGTLTYSLSAHNNGPSSAGGVTLTDTLPAGVTYQSATPSQGSCSQASGIVTCNFGTVANGGTATATIAVTPQSAGTITNTASVVAAPVDPSSANNNSSVQTTVNPVSDLALTKTGSPDPVLVGETLTYNLTAHNNGPSGATGVTLTDTLPAGVTYQSATPSQGSCSQANGTVTCSLGSLANGGSASVSITVTPQSAGTITNTATVAGAQTDPVAPNNGASAQTTVDPVADLSVTKTDSPDPVLVGGALTYSLTVHNSGPSGATGVTLTDTLPAGVTYHSATPSQGSCDQASGTVTCNLGALANGGSATVAISVTPQSAGTITNTASVAGAETDPVTPNNAASAQTTVDSVADLALTKADFPDPTLVGGTLTYNLTVQNSGPSGATGVTLTDNLPAGVSYVFADPSQGTCGHAGGTVTCDLGAIASSGSATVDIAVVPQNDGTITNTASVVAAETDPSSANNSASAQTTVRPVADLALTKTDSTDPVFAGGTLTYNLAVQNNGPSGATDVTLTDSLPASFVYESATPSQGTCNEASGLVSCSLGAVANGASATVQIAVTPQAVGTFTNTASVQTTAIDLVPGNDDASESTTVLPAPDLANLALTKTDTADPVPVGGTLTYNLTIQNNGPSRATGVTVTDNLPGGVSYQSATPSQGSCEHSSGTVTCNLGAIAGGGSVTVAIQVTPLSDGTITNTASVQGAQTDPSSANNEASEQTTISPVADLALTKSDSPDPAQALAELTYSLTVQNNGPSSATGVTVTDNLPPSVNYSSATPSQGSCTQASGTVSCALGSIASGSSASVLIRVTPQSTGTITNSASAQASETDPANANNSASESTQVVQNGYARPRGASPSVVRLVPAYEQCSSGNAMHGGGWNVTSCDPPVQSSGFLTVGTPDVNGHVANMTGLLTLKVVGESPINPNNGDQADVDITAQITDVRLRSDSAAYTGELEGVLGLRITDRLSGPGSTTPATVADAPLPFVFACALAGPDIGGQCNVATTVDTIMPGLVVEGKRSVWQLSEVKVYDGGPDGDAGTADNTLFAIQGLFTP